MILKKIISEILIEKRIKRGITDFTQVNLYQALFTVTLIMTTISSLKSEKSPWFKRMIRKSCYLKKKKAHKFHFCKTEFSTVRLPRTGYNSTPLSAIEAFWE